MISIFNDTGSFKKDGINISNHSAMFYSSIKSSDYIHIIFHTFLFFYLWFFGFDVIDWRSPLIPPFPFQSVYC